MSQDEKKLTHSQAKQLHELIAEHSGVDRIEIASSRHLVNDLNMDSLDTVELAMAIEEAFDVEIADEDMDKVSTVGDLENLLNELL